MQEWANVVPAAKVNPSAPMKSLFCPTSETTAFSWLLHSSVTQNQASLVVGPAGCGKTTAVRGLLRTLCAATDLHARPEESNCWELKLPESSCCMHHVEVDLSSQTNVETMQRRVRGWFGRKVAGVRKPAGGGSLVAFVDDISMPVPETSGAQPPVEVLRQLQVLLSKWEVMLLCVCLGSIEYTGCRCYHMPRAKFLAV